MVESYYTIETENKKFANISTTFIGAWIKAFLLGCRTSQRIVVTKWRVVKR